MQRSLARSFDEAYDQESHLSEVSVSKPARGMDIYICITVMYSTGTISLSSEGTYRNALRVYTVNERLQNFATRVSAN